MSAPIVLTTIAAQINAEHTEALKHADQAIDHARRAGALLQSVKDQLAHGEWLPWLTSNSSVSERQAQRYMRAALGKSMSVRAAAWRIVRGCRVGRALELRE